MVLCLLVEKVEFRKITDAEKTQVVPWPMGEEEPIVVGTGFVLLSLLEMGMMTGTVIWDKISDNVHVMIVNT